jgi:tryptophan-rich sensory protein
MKWLVLAGFLALCLFAGYVGSLLTNQSVKTWYPTLQKPSGTPPDWVFPAVWTTLYIVMAIAAWLVWAEAGWYYAKQPLILFFAQLAMNVAWSAIFFNSRQPGFAFGWIVLLWLAIFSTMIVFYAIKPLAGILLVPYIAWITYASFLNFGIWRLNRA